MDIVIALVCIVGLLAIIFNLLKKNEIYEAEIEQLYSRIEESTQNLDNIYAHITNALTTMRYIDSLQIFEQDDEVGSVFQELNEVLTRLDSLIYEDIDGEKKTN